MLLVYIEIARLDSCFRISRGTPHQSLEVRTRYPLAPFPRSPFKIGHISVNSTPHRTQASLTHCPDAHKDTVSFRPIHSPTYIPVFPKSHAEGGENPPTISTSRIKTLGYQGTVDGKGLSILPTRARDFGYFASSVDRARSASECAFLNPFEQAYQMWRRVVACRAPYAQFLFIVAYMMSREDGIRDLNCSLPCCR